MLVECILRRKGGTNAEVNGRTYHFAPNATGNHVADVRNKDDFTRFMQIPEAYTPYVEAGEFDEDEPEPVAAPDPEPVAAAEPIIPDVETAPIATAAPDPAPAASGFNIKSMSRNELEAAYEAAYDRKPHGKMTEETLRQKVQEAYDSASKAAGAE